MSNITEENFDDLMENKTLFEEVKKINSLYELIAVETLITETLEDLQYDFYGHTPDKEVWDNIKYLQNTLNYMDIQKQKFNGTYKEWVKTMTDPKNLLTYSKLMEDQKKFEQDLFG